MPDPNRRYAYLALSILAAIWVWVYLGRPTSLCALFGGDLEPVEPLAGFTYGN